MRFINGKTLTLLLLFSAIFIPTAFSFETAVGGDCIHMLKTRYIDLGESGRGRVWDIPAGSDGNPGTTRYNGFISSMKWKGPGDEYVRVYTYDYGFRSYDPSLTTWTSMDPLCEQYPNLSPYVYCVGNPVNYVDLDGRDALRIVDEDEKTLTVKATYYVVSMDRPYRENGSINYVPGYTPSDIQDMTSYNDYLNGLNLTVKEGKYEGFSIKFDLFFESTLSPETADVQSKSAITEQGDSYGNTIQRGNSITDPLYNFNIVNNPDGSFTTTGGVTLNNQNIIMNYGYDTKMNIIHEIFHTFGLDHPTGGAKNGILHYPPQTPNANDAFRISVTPNLPTIIKR